MEIKPRKRIFGHKKFPTLVAQDFDENRILALKSPETQRTIENIEPLPRVLKESKGQKCLKIENARSTKILGKYLSLLYLIINSSSNFC